MNIIEQNLANSRASLMASIPVAGLISRNSTAYKWKASVRCWLLREAAFWRITDLLTQSYALHQQDHFLGARILMRSSLETLSTLIYLNLLIQKVLDGELDFYTFSAKTSVLLLGSRDHSTNHTAINIVTVLDKCEKQYPGIVKLYGMLSESAHPNYEGLVEGYCTVNHDGYEACFSNRWKQLYAGSHLESMEFCMRTFHHEYNEIWPDLMGKLENWIVANDAYLEANKDIPKGEGQL